AHLVLSEVEGHGGERGHRYSTVTPVGVITAMARRAEWHWMLTATGFIVMWVAAISTWTAKAVLSPPRPWGPMPRLLAASESSASSAAPSGSAQIEPKGRVAALLARCMQR